MAKLYIFAIGGTGARVLRAFSALLASNVDVGNYEIVPMYIDLDEPNGDLKKSIDQIKRYRAISNATNYATGLFKNKIRTLGDIIDDRAIRDNFKQKFGNINTTFYDYIGGPALEQIDRDFLSLLYNDEPLESPFTELNLTLDKGFRGNPNIGAVVFNSYVNSEEFQKFTASFGVGDKIMLISSIFGGTGSSGFPQIVENLNNSENNYVRLSSKGAVIVQPYFKIESNKDSSINSDLFNSKTKAALHYYRDHLSGLEKTYYVGDESQNFYTNVMGGEGQQNKAHHVELISATAILDFLINPGTGYYEFGIADLHQQQVTRNHFFSGSPLDKMIKVGLFCKLHSYILNNYHTFEIAMMSIHINQNTLNNFTDLNSYVEDIRQMIMQMKENNRQLNFINLDDNNQLTNFIFGNIAHINNINDKDFIGKMIKSAENANISYPDPISKYVGTLDHFIENNIIKSFIN